MNEQNQDQSFDVIVVGSGAGAITAAITAAKQGLKTVIIEKASTWGGSSSLSGGGVWIPNNPVSVAAGLKDSFEEALTYLETVIEDVGPASSKERKMTFLQNGPEMIRFLQNEGMSFIAGTLYPDYYPDKPGGKIGRSLDCEFFDRCKLGELSKTLRVSDMLPPIPFSTSEVAHLPKAFTQFKHFFKVVDMFARGTKLKISGKQALGLGNALVAQLMFVAQKYDVPVWLNTPCNRLIMEGEKVVGIEVTKDGGPLSLYSNAVILAAGGFERNAEMRQKYQGVGSDWTVANPDNTGDVIKQCMDIGADMALLDDSWWGAVAVDHKGNRHFLVWERSMPHSLIVDQSGERYMNESQSYVDVGHDMLKQNKEGKAIPSWLILESRNRNRYIFGMAMPRLTPKEYIEEGFFLKANTIEELAEKCEINSENLQSTILRFNEFADKGVDEDFERGRTTYDNYYGDPNYKNPNLGKIEKGPFYAVKIYPGDLGTKGGMVTDEYARVLKDGEPISGLYATGNCSASVMGRTYPGPGSTLGPAMVFSYIAAKHLAENESKDMKISS
ncbi:FAD-binding protein [Litchfieldia salsa]|uniref:3-oxosteroid 1-dehydrogenase n=1 Tax=Litchfieldia salsa TaxID=930152 RepID=A0A1H0VLS8_9BACI|nr:FAD-binding protein [Litchfieldia salsa]SDP79016.1 3-oxosteroid 1-dehydrogenase [Litchfieldia salsa]